MCLKQMHLYNSVNIFLDLCALFARVIYMLLSCSFVCCYYATQVQKQDMCENDWLYLYTEFALFCFWSCNEVFENGKLIACFGQVLCIFRFLSTLVIFCAAQL